MQQLLTCSVKYLCGEVGLLKGVEGHVQAALVICEFSCTKYRYRLRSANRYFLSDTFSNQRRGRYNTYRVLIQTMEELENFNITLFVTKRLTRKTYVSKLLHYMRVPFTQCCGAENIYFGSGSAAIPNFGSGSR
jgi:hypothetical protein